MKEAFIKIGDYIESTPDRVRDIFHGFIKECKIIRKKVKNLPQTNYDLGIYHINRCNMSDAKMRFFFVTKLDPKMALAYYHLARCHLFNLEYNKAKKYLEHALTLDKNLKEARYRLQQINHNVLLEPIPLQVIEEDFDNLANKYEDYIQNHLLYTAPEILANILKPHVQGVDDLWALDIGCGTGIAGYYLKQNVAIKSLHGIDVSQRMLALSKELVLDDKHVYNLVEKEDFYNLTKINDKFDIVIACMSLCYSNNLSKIFVELDRVSTKNAIFGLVLLKSKKEDIIFDYKNGCFGFSLSYLKGIFDKHQLKILEQAEIELFSNGSKGFIFILKR